MIGKYFNENNKYIKYLLFAGVFLGTISTIVGVVNTLPNWIKPKVKVSGIDYDKGIAQIEINGKIRELIGDATLTAGGDWGVKFGYDTTSDKYETVELIKNGMVYEIIDKKITIDENPILKIF